MTNTEQVIEATEFFGCGCCGNEIGETDLWCKPCESHIGSIGHLHERTYFALYKKTCPFAPENHPGRITEAATPHRAWIAGFNSGYAALVSELERVKGEKEKLAEACKKALTCASINSDVRSFIQSALADTKGDNNDDK